ncbi:MAG: trypsin-like peptidase domain-containing protein [Gammaproteobacteria bacterium]|nr:trypsin-like peptidase domain-containing protein [Gammaproteobacteria bacterium]
MSITLTDLTDRLRWPSSARTLLYAVLLGLLSAQAQASEAPQGLKDAMVKIFTVSSEYDYFRPWTKSSPQQSNGSGCVIAGNRILTNAHVVSNATYVQVRRNGDGKRYEARVEHVIHDADLALLTVDDPAFFENIQPIELGDLPAAQSDVTVYGFPRGGDALSITKGVVSRIENQVYSHSGLYLLAGQIDAAVNPGNSGGPVIQDRRLVGVVMQTLAAGENQGYMVPVDLVKRVLTDLEDGRYDGFPALGVRVQNLENPAANAHYHLPVGSTGALVVQVQANSTSAGVLRPDDVILEVEGNEIGDDGKFVFRGDERNSWQMLMQQHQIGEPFALTIWREGQRMQIDVPLRLSVHDNQRIPDLRHDASPRYFIYGGLVFAPVTENLLRRFGKQWRDNAPTKLIYLMDYDNVPDEAVREWVVLQNVLPADANKGYHSATFLIIERFNGEPIRDLDHLVELVEANADERAIFTTDLGFQIILNSAQAQAEQPHILERYGISQDRAL